MHEGVGIPDLREEVGRDGPFPRGAGRNGDVGVGDVGRDRLSGVEQVGEAIEP